MVVNAAALAGLVISAAAPFLRLRRGGCQQRQQLKWVAFTVAVSVLSVLVSLGLRQLFPGVLVIVLLGLLGPLRECPLGRPVPAARHRTQAVVDRRFNQRKYNAAKTVEAFSTRLRDEVDLDTLSTEPLAVVDETVQPARASLLRPPTQMSPQ